MLPKPALSSEKMVASKKTTWISKWVLPDIAILSFCVLLLGMIWVTAFAQIEQDREDAIRTIRHDGDMFSRSFEEHVRTIAKTGNQYIAMLKDEYEASQEITPAMGRLLSKIGQDPLLLQALVINANGGVMASPKPYPADVNLAEVPHFVIHRAADSGKEYIGRPMIGRISGETSIHMSRRLNNSDGSFGGIAHIAIEAGYFTKFFRDLDLPDGYVIRVIGLDHIVRASSVADELGINMANADLFKRIDSQSSGFYRGAGLIFGKPLFVSYRVMPDYPLIVQVGVAEDSALASTLQRVMFIWGLPAERACLRYSSLVG